MQRIIICGMIPGMSATDCQDSSSLLLHHAMIAISPGTESEACQFSVGILQPPEIDKPAILSGRGGLWFAAGDLGVHPGVDRLSFGQSRHISRFGRKTFTPCQFDCDREVHDELGR